MRSFGRPPYADPFGYAWFVASREEDVSPQEMQRRWQAMMAAPGAAA